MMEDDYNNNSFIVKYAPKSVEDFILPEYVKNIFRKPPSEIGHLFLFGKPGTGKTSIVETFLEENDLIHENYRKIRGGLASGINDIRIILDDFKFLHLPNSDRKFVLFDECETLHHSVFEALKNYINESEAFNITYIFTANDISRIPEAIIDSRCTAINFDFSEEDLKSMLKPMGNFILKILKNENFDLDENKNVFVNNILKSTFPDKRKTLNSIQEYIRSFGRVIDLENMNKIFYNENSKIVKMILDKDNVFSTKEIVDFILKNNHSPERTGQKVINSLINLFKETILVEFLLMEYTKYDTNFKYCTDKKINLLTMIFALKKLIKEA